MSEDKFGQMTPGFTFLFFFIPMTLSIYSFFALKQQNNTAVNIEILSTSNPPPLNQPPPPTPGKKKNYKYPGLYWDTCIM